jgi:hypothetical protein
VLWTIVLFVKSVPLGKHAPVQHTRNPDSSRCFTVEDHMPAAFHPPQSGTHIIAASTETWIACRHLTTRLQLVQITASLDFATSLERLTRDAHQVGFCAT